jgi:hypothetical protein
VDLLTIVDFGFLNEEKEEGRAETSDQKSTIVIQQSSIKEDRVKRKTHILKGLQTLARGRGADATTTP